MADPAGQRNAARASDKGGRLTIFFTSNQTARSVYSKTNKTMKTTPKLPHQDDRLYISDGGLETTLIFLNGIDLPCFAAFDLLKSDAGTGTLRDYYRTYAAMARDHATGFILESPTWRASPDWAAKLGYDAAALAAANRAAIDLMHGLRAEYETADSPFVISGCVGPRGDGYQPGALMTAAEAAAYHAPQIQVFREEDVDLITAVTMNDIGEAIGIADAAAEAGIPSVISLTTETNGRLPTGHSLAEAITVIDATARVAPAYYMINCAHPTHFHDALPDEAPWLDRILGVRANASCRSHAELDESTDLDAGDPHDLAEQYLRLREKLSRLCILGGCCGTDHRHIHAMCGSFLPSIRH